jgi:hypothetical protein
LTSTGPDGDSAEKTLGRCWNTADRKKTKTPLARGLTGFLELIWNAKHFGKLDIAVVNAGILMLGDVGTVSVGYRH